jgi:hypothetical protein
MRSCIVLFTTTPEYRDDEKRKPLHYYGGGFHFGIPTYYVTSYKDGRIGTSLNKKDAKHFTNDVECTKCMEQIVATKNPWTIAVWNYETNKYGEKKLTFEGVHYPNEHWSRNNNLQPSLMYRSVSDFDKNGNV